MTEIELFKQDFRLHASAHQTHLKYWIDVPKNVEQLTILFNYQPLLEEDPEPLKHAFRREGLPASLLKPGEGFQNLLTLTVSDSQGFRGARHYFDTDQEVIINKDEASFGFMAGEIEAGQWEIVISCHGLFSNYVEGQIQVMGQVNSKFSYRKANPLSKVGKPWIKLKSRPQSSLQSRFYRAELHAHTLHSDGSQRSRSLLEQAQGQEIAWLAITDHNTISAIEEISDFKDDFPEIQIIPGLEYTTFHGHLLIHGHRELVRRDWTELNLANVDQVIKDLQSLGLIVTIAHPFSLGNPYCTGCRWDYPLKNLKYVDNIEVWNGPSPQKQDYNQKAFDRWVDLINNGYQVNASIGRDWHGPHDKGDQLPYTYILLPEAASLDQVLTALRIGRTYASVRPLLNQLIVNDHYQIGDRIRETVNNWQLQIQIKQLKKGDQILIHSNKGLIDLINVDQEEIELKRNFADSKDLFIRLEVRDQANELVLFTNPIYRTI